jgi:hypothetical protein
MQPVAPMTGDVETGREPRDLIDTRIPRERNPDRLVGDQIEFPTGLRDLVDTDRYAPDTRWTHVCLPAMG